MCASEPLQPLVDPGEGIRAKPLATSWIVENLHISIVIKRNISNSFESVFKLIEVLEEAISKVFFNFVKIVTCTTPP